MAHEEQRGGSSLKNSKKAHLANMDRLMSDLKSEKEKKLAAALRAQARRWPAPCSPATASWLPHAPRPVPLPNCPDSEFPAKQV